MEEKGFTEGVKAATPTVFGYTSIGLALGIVAAKSGISPLETGLMSLIVYSGSGQFVLCALILAKAPLASIALTVFLLVRRGAQDAALAFNVAGSPGEQHLEHHYQADHLVSPC